MRCGNGGARKIGICTNWLMAVHNFPLGCGQCVAEMKKHTKAITGVAVAPCGVYGSVAEDGKLYVFEREDATVRWTETGC